MDDGIAACQRCAGRDFRMPGFADGLVPETDNFSEWVCRRCGLKAVPLIFDEEEAYEAFAADRRQGEGQARESGRDTS